MKMILASIKPYYYYLVAEGIKKIEVRKSAPKPPFDVCFYMSKDEKSFAKIPKGFQEKYRKHFGKVGFKGLCEKTYTYNIADFGDLNGIHAEHYFIEDLKPLCLSIDELDSYGAGKTLYGLHINELKCFDPKELSVFKNWSDKDISKPPMSWQYVLQ